MTTDRIFVPFEELSEGQRLGAPKCARGKHWTTGGSHWMCPRCGAEGNDEFIACWCDGLAIFLRDKEVER